MEDALAKLLTEPIYQFYAYLWRIGVVEVD